ncbi:aldehyde reductase [Chakrabartia godavariana]|nr:aldehyde reductase [Chakrabartia godavariana]
MSGQVFVSGGSGYIAGFLIRQLIEEGWMVHTSIRNLAREADVRGWLNVDNGKLKFFAADLMSDDGWAEAMAGCTHVAHVASPIPSNAPKHEDELIVPAREGALRALRFAKEAGIKRFVMTSSVTAIAYGHGGAKHHFTEADWTNVDSPDAYPYVKSKTIAERAARDWVAASGSDMEFVTVNPSLVLGPLMAPDFSTSLEAVKKLMDGSLPGLPHFGFSVVDVRDVADLHVRCLTAPNMAGERFIAAGPFLWMREVAAILKQGLGPQGRKVPTRKLPNFLVKLSALFDPVIKQVVGELDNVRDASAQRAKDILGWQTRDPAESILDTARDMIRLGVVKV